ncbi:MAG TPA: VWA domain-containing protein [Candidatus Nanoarchaeia archaeon]|nr:VWA domain-containing protein [Candidatus Nanoarchaeia archaeon]
MQTAVIYFDSHSDVQKLEAIEEKKGKLASQFEENKLMKSVLENDKQTIKEGKLIKDALNVGLNSFTPDLIFEQLVKNYSITKKMLGPSLVRELTDYDASYVDKNVRIPEFQREMRKNIQKNIERLQDKDLITKEGMISDPGIELASLILYTEELDSLVARGMAGERIHKKAFLYGDKEDVRNYRKGDRYRDIAIKQSVKLAVRRGDDSIHVGNIKSFERQSKGRIHIIYALDASGSMKGRKIETCKKAGIALAFKAIQERDKVGLMVFGSEIKEAISPTADFMHLLRHITGIRAAKETNLAQTIIKSMELFLDKQATKHLVLLTDVMPTVGKDPENETLEAASMARAAGITISLIGVQLEKKAEKLAEQIVELGKGRLYLIRNLDDLDKVVLEDYYGI